MENIIKLSIILTLICLFFQTPKIFTLSQLHNCIKLYHCLYLSALMINLTYKMENEIISTNNDLGYN